MTNMTLQATTCNYMLDKITSNYKLFQAITSFSRDLQALHAILIDTPLKSGNSISVRNVELMSQCSECLFQGWNETYADPLPMEFAM